MKKNLFLILLFLVLNNLCLAQKFNGDGIAIHKDSSVIVSWAVSAIVERGYINIADTTQTYTERGITSNKAFQGSIENVIGKANGLFLSLGDGGHIILEFGKPITNGPGPDFAVFENIIFTPPNQPYLGFVELAFVEVSSDGINYERFPAISQQPYEKQIGTFDTLDFRLFKNFAGVYPVFYGYPFDLDDIPGEVVDKSKITHVKIIDVVGNIDTKYARLDSQGNIINDPWPTPFATCGFDLDAVGVIHELGGSSTTDFITQPNISIFPNPAKDYIHVQSDELIESIKLVDISGKEIREYPTYNYEHRINIENINSGIYLLIVKTKNDIFSKKIIVND